MKVFRLTQIADCHDFNGTSIREDEAIGSQVFIPGVDDTVQHTLEEQKVAHPFRDEDVDLGLAERHLLDATANQLDLILHVVLADDGHGVEDYVRLIDADDFGGAGLDGEHGENARSAAQVQDDLAGHLTRVAHDGISVALRPRLVLRQRKCERSARLGPARIARPLRQYREHVVVNTEVGVSSEVAILVVFDVVAARHGNLVLESRTFPFDFADHVMHRLKKYATNQVDINLLFPSRPNDVVRLQQRSHRLTRTANLAQLEKRNKT